MVTEALEKKQARTREEALNIAQAKWRKECGKTLVVGEEDENEDTAAKGRSTTKVTMVGDEGVSRLFTEATSMEMLLDCRSALWAIGNTLSKTSASNMLQPAGAPLVAHFWLALRTLIKVMSIFRVAHTTTNFHILKTTHRSATFPAALLAYRPPSDI